MSGVSPTSAAPASPLESDDAMDWTLAQVALLDGKKIRRTEWPDQNVCVYLANLDEEYLVVRHADMSLHPILLRGVDVRANDWVVVREN